MASFISLGDLAALDGLCRAAPTARDEWPRPSLRRVSWAVCTAVIPEKPVQRGECG